MSSEAKEREGFSSSTTPASLTKILIRSLSRLNSRTPSNTIPLSSLSLNSVRTVTFSFLFPLTIIFFFFVLDNFCLSGCVFYRFGYMTGGSLRQKGMAQLFLGLLQESKSMDLFNFQPFFFFLLKFCDHVTVEHYMFLFFWLIFWYKLFNQDHHVRPIL